MAKRMIELTTTKEAKAALAEPRPVRCVRVRLHVLGDQQWHEMNGWLRVPAWTRRFNGWTVGAVVRLAVAGLVAALAFGWWLLRLLGRAR